ncbi:Ig-like domain-containing protein, partial [Phaeodactylibacter sp.]
MVNRIRTTKTWLSLSGWLSLLFFTLNSGQAQNQITYGFLQNPSDPREITAVAYPNFNSSNADISTALFTFSLPDSTLTDPVVPDVPAIGSMVNITGTWSIQRLTPGAYINLSLSPAVLQGNDVYSAVLNPGSIPLNQNLASGMPIELFSFRLPDDCFDGNLAILENDSPYVLALNGSTGANFNNQISVSLDNQPVQDLYSGNEPNGFIDCPLDGQPLAFDDTLIMDEDSGPVNVVVTANDNFGPDGPAVGAITLLTGVFNGSVALNDAGSPDDPTDDSYDYNPNTDFFGLDSLTYEICDLDGDCDTATLRIEVRPVDDLLQANDDTNTAVENGPSVDGNVLVGGVSPGDVPDILGDEPTTVTAVVDGNGDALTLGAAFTTDAGG